MKHLFFNNFILQFYLISICLNLFQFIYTQAQSVIPYNFVNQQNYEIDLVHKYILGTNLYFYSNDNSSLFMVDVNPNLTLEINFKLYTNDTNLINLIESDGTLYFGLDFMINNTDKSIPDLRSDVVLCFFNKNNANCYDYVYNLKTMVYSYNTGNKLMKNNIIPLGFNKTTTVVINDKVIGYNSYYSISFNKDYTRNFDNITMFNYFYYQAKSLKAQVKAFYGQTNEQNIYDSNFTFSLKDTYFEYSLDFDDGAGLSNYSSFIKFSFYCLIFLFILI